MFHLSTLKNAKYCKENDAFYAELIIHSTMQSRCAPEGAFGSAPKDTLRDLHKMHKRVYVRLH